MSLDPEQAITRAKIAAFTRWAHDPDRKANGERGQAGLLAKFEREVDPNNELPPEERLRRAESLRKAHMHRLALASSKARKAAA